MAPLPPPDDSLHPPTLSGAYSMCFRRENAILAGSASEQSLINVRLVGFLLLHWPSQAARRTIALEITTCKEEEIERIGQRYYDHLLRMFKSNKGRIPTPSLHMSRPSFDRKADLVKAMLVEAPQDHRTSKRKALIRDGFRCVVTSRYDGYAGQMAPELLDEIEASGKETVSTQCAHIFSESTNASIAGPDTGDTKSYAASAWTIMSTLGYPNILQELNGSRIHHLGNVMTMSVDVHTKFDRLDIWFQEMDIPNTYKLCASKNHLRLGYPETVAFKNHSELDLPLPSPTYLKIHAACAIVAHLSGAAERIDTLLREIEEMQVLAQDGTSAEIMQHATLSHPITT